MQKKNPMWTEMLNFPSFFILFLLNTFYIENGSTRLHYKFARYQKGHFQKNFYTFPSVSFESETVLKCKSTTFLDLHKIAPT